MIHNALNSNTLWPGDAIWQHRSGSALAQVMVWCLLALSHYLNQYWLIIRGDLWHMKTNFIGSAQDINSSIEFKKLLPHLPGANKLNLILQPIRVKDGMTQFPRFKVESSYLNAGPTHIYRNWTWWSKSIPLTSNSSSLFYGHPLVLIQGHHSLSCTKLIHMSMLPVTSNNFFLGGKWILREFPTFFLIF